MTRKKGDPKAKAVADRLGLTAKEDALVEAFLRTRNKALAYRTAGFPEAQRRSAYAIFKRPHIRQAIGERLEENRLETDAALAILHDHATGTLESFITFEEVDDPNAPGEQKHDGQETPKRKMTIYHLDLNRARQLQQLGVVKKLTPNKYGISIELHDPIRAIEVYAKVAGWIKEPGEGGNGSQTNDESLNKLVTDRAKKK